MEQHDQAWSADALRLDGNAAAGLMSELFVPDLTAAQAKCAGCGDSQPVGVLMTYTHGMGTVMRCRSCDAVVLRIARTPTTLWFEATGAASISVTITV